MATTRIVCLLIAVSLLVGSSQQICVMRSNCTVDNDTCIPYITNLSDPMDFNPQKWEFPEEYKGICPEYENTENCCNSNTFSILHAKLFSLDLAFGNSITGCSHCANNLKRFFCKYSCDPNQHLFVKPGQIKYMDYSPGPGKDSFKVVASNITVDPKAACSIYESCKSVDFAKALGSMANYIGFFNTLSSQGIEQGRVIMNYSFTQEEGTLKTQINNCSIAMAGPTDQYNYSFYQGQGWCNCQHCSYNCSMQSMDFGLYIKKHGVLDGLSLSTLKKAGLIAAVILLLGLLLRFTLFSGSSSKSEPVKEDIETGKSGYFAMKA